MYETILHFNKYLLLFEEEPRSGISLLTSRPTESREDNYRARSFGKS